jgi:hypothetical protein
MEGVQLLEWVASMSDKATTKQTGGEGFTFADRIAARFLALMLQRDLSLGVEMGPILSVDFETSESNNHLDDLAAAFESGAHLYLSIKSNRQLTKAGFNREFVADAWEQLSRTAERYPFDPERDLIGLTLGSAEDVVMDDWNTLYGQLLNSTPERVVARLKGVGQTNVVQRAIFESLRGTKGEQSHDPIETARLASRIRLYTFTDREKGEAINLCAQIVQGGALPDAAKLWDALQTISAESRGKGAHYDLPRLLGSLRRKFDLRDYPDYADDWVKLEAISKENIASETGDTLSGGIHLPRSETRNALKTSFANKPVTVVVGESGSGKSGLLAGVVTSGELFRRVLWLTAEQVAKPSQEEVSKTLGLRHTVTELITGSTVKNAVLVIDGFEQFEKSAQKSLIRWIKVLQSPTFEDWRVVVTCQPRSTEAVRDILVDAGVRSFDSIEFEKPKLSEVLSATEAVPSLVPLLLRKELQPILRNLLVLDWVIREEVAQRIPVSRPWIGETEIIDIIWERWIGRDAKKLARDRMLRLLGEREGAMVFGSVPLDSFDGTLELVGELEEKGLVRTERGTIRFFHDLMGDWARYRVLTFAGERLIGQVTTVANMPRWGRGIRLYAQSLAEKESGLEGWRAFAAQLPPDRAESQLAADLVLDALLLAPNSEMLLEQVWDDLVVDGGGILKRLLQRLLYVASIPDPRFQNLADRDLAESAEAVLRIPHPLYWIPALRVLSQHALEVARLLPVEIAEVCALWLRTIPSGSIGSNEAGVIAVAAAMEIQGRILNKPRSGKGLKVVFEALLYAAAERPEVGVIALELAGRLPEPDHAIQRSMDLEQERDAAFKELEKRNPSWSRERRTLRPGITSYRSTHAIAPEADGPSREIPASFRSAVLDSQALVPLMASQPAVAKEVLLAVCIHEPDESASESKFQDLIGPRLGLSDWPEGRLALPWKGGFLRFLETDPETALATIMDLVNYATAQWLKWGLGTPQAERSVLFEPQTFAVGGREVAWFGDATVFGWNRLQAIKAPQVECALMALEQWLDAEVCGGRSIERWVSYCFEHGDSISFAGVFVSVGIKHPKLFTGALQPLLGNYAIYRWQQSIAKSDAERPWLLSLLQQPQMVIQSALEWHEQPSRTCLLRDVAVRLVLQHAATAKYLADRKSIWAHEVKLKGEAKINFEFFLARFDPANYLEQPIGDGCVPPAIKWPEGLQKIADESLPAVDLQMLEIHLAQSARKLLSGESVMADAQVPELIKQVRDLFELEGSIRKGSNAYYRATSIAGGLAVLIVLHAEWLAKHPAEEAWVIRTLRTLEPVFPERHSPHVPNNLTVESFLGEAAMSLLTKSDEEWIRRMAFDGVTATTYTATSDSMLRAYHLRSELGNHFTALVNVVLYWSALRHACTRATSVFADIAILAKQKRALLDRFLAGKLVRHIPICRVERLGRYLLERIERNEYSNEYLQARRDHLDRLSEDRLEIEREMPGMDLEILRLGLSFLGLSITDSHVLNELDGRLLSQLFDLEIASFPVGNDALGWRKVEGTPWEFDRWILQLIAVHSARLNTEEAMGFCRSVLRIAPAANYWGRAFLNAWVVDGLPRTLDASVYVATWNAMVDYVWPLQDWQATKPSHHCPAEYVVDHLCGLHEDQIAVLGRGQYQAVVSGMAEALAAWAKRWLPFESLAQGYACFLTTESGRALLPQGLIHLASCVEQYRVHELKRYELGELLSTALSVAWVDSYGAIRSQPKVQEAFLKILTNLCARPIPRALQLRSKIGNTLNSLS